MKTLLKTQKSDSVTAAVLKMHEVIEAKNKMHGHYETMRAMRSLLQQYKERGLNPCDDIHAFNDFVKTEYQNQTEIK